MQIFYLVSLVLVVMIIGYLVGGIPTALIISEKMGIDIRKYGSHNLGGTNVGRVIGKKQGILVMGLDILKSYLPCLITALFFTFVPMDFLPNIDCLVELMVSVMGISCCLGHTFTPYANFKGGKAVACFAGYILFTAPIIALVGVVIFFLCLKFAKRVSVGSILGVPCCFLASLVTMSLDLTVLNDKTVYDGGAYFGTGFMIHITYVTTITCFILSVLIVLRHLSNIKRLAKGDEPETHFKKND